MTNEISVPLGTSHGTLTFEIKKNKADISLNNQTIENVSCRIINKSSFISRFKSNILSIRSWVYIKVPDQDILIKISSLKHKSGLNKKQLRAHIRENHWNEIFEAVNTKGSYTKKRKQTKSLDSKSEPLHIDIKIREINSDGIKTFIADSESFLDLINENMDAEELKLFHTINDTIQEHLRKIEALPDADELRKALLKLKLSRNAKAILVLSNQLKRKLEKGITAQELDSLHYSATVLLGLFSALKKTHEEGNVAFLDLNMLEDSKLQAKQFLQAIEAEQKKLAGSDGLIDQFVLEFLEPYLTSDFVGPDIDEKFKKNRAEELKGGEQPLIDLLRDFLLSNGIKMDESIEQRAIDTFALSGLRYVYSYYSRDRLKILIKEKLPDAQPKRMDEILFKLSNRSFVISERSDIFTDFLQILARGLKEEFKKDLTDDEVAEIGQRALEALNKPLLHEDEARGHDE